MIHMSVPKYLWSDAILSACYLINKTPSSVLDSEISFSCFYPTKSVFSMTPCVFGCTYFVQDLSLGLDKLSPRSIKCVIVGQSRAQKGYMCYNLSAGKYSVSGDITFFETVLYFPPHHPAIYLKLFLFQCVPLPASFPAHASDDFAPIIVRHFRATCIQCFKYRILAIYRSAKLYTGYRIPGDISRYGTKYRTSYRTSYRMKNIHVSPA